MFVGLQYSFGFGWVVTNIDSCSYFDHYSIHREKYVSCVFCCYFHDACMCLLTFYIPLADDPQIHTTMAHIHQSETLG